MRTNRAKQKLARGEVVTALGGFMTPDVVDFLGPAGFDVIWLEGEHGPLDYSLIPDLTRACDLWGMTSLVRVNRNVPGIIYRSLDLGAQGIAVPHVNTAAEARAVVDAARFYPTGRRGMCPSRQGYGASDFFIRANAETLVVVLVEDVVAIENLPRLLEVPEIDVYFVAAGDLGQSMGLLQWPPHPDVTEAVARAVRTIVAAGRTAGAIAGDGEIEGMLDLGARFLYTEWPDWLLAAAHGYAERVATAAAAQA
ncbi:MAG: hypothetical protein FJ029_11370 [Actinobacteria bacterium]|nr:hypothetical protein [Actinomycetota bacterium]